MGEVVGTLKVMPENPDVDLDTLKESIKSVINENEFEKIDEEPVAFGLVALNVTIVVDDGEGGTEPSEKALSELDNVASVEVTDIRRLM